MTKNEDAALFVDAFDPLLVNLHDALRAYRTTDKEENTNVNGILDAVVSILDANLTYNEQVLAADVLLGLIKQAEKDIRMSLSDRLAPRDDINPELLHFLAYDEIDVAEPVLLYSPLLSDTDLIYIIESKAKDHWRTIARRDNIAEAVTNTLIKKRDDVTAINVLKNKTVSLSKDALHNIKPIATESTDVAEALLAYKHLPKSIAVDLYWHVSNAIRQEITKKFAIHADEIDAALQDSMQDFADTMLQANNFRPSNLMIDVAAQYYESKKINDTLFINTLRRRQGRFFIALFAKQTNLSFEVIWNMMRQVGGQGMAVACRAMNVSKENFVSLFLLSRTIVKSSQAVDANELRMAMRYYDGLTHKMAKEILEDSIAK